MHLESIRSGTLHARSGVVPAQTHGHHVPASLLSRRQLLRGVGGAAALGTTLGLSRRASAAPADPGIGLAVPIPSTLEFFPGVEGHVLAPPLTGADSDPSTVYNFQGASAIAFISGEVDRRNRRTGDVQTLPFVFNDMRFMSGKFRGRDGHFRDGTFAFI